MPRRSRNPARSSRRRGAQVRGPGLREKKNAQVRQALFDAAMSLFRDQGFEATSVDEASALAADIEGISVVLSDIRLEGSGTGLDLIRRLPSDLPCILMTSLPLSDPLHRQALAQGPVLRKPFSRAQLSALLRPEAA